MLNSNRVTIKDIAKYVDLSVSTVSRALSDHKNIKKETKERVLEAAHALNYKSNPIGSSLRSGVTKTIGVLVPEMITPFAAQVVYGIQDTLKKEKYKVIIAQSDEDPQKEKENLLLMENFMVDGIIICPSNYIVNKEEYVRLQTNRVPIVFYDRIPHGLDVSSVVVDDYHESFFMVEHLIRSGRNKIAHIQGPSYIYNSIERAKGYKDALKKFRVAYDESLVVQTGMTIDDGRKAAELLLERGIVFDAVFSFTETLALGAMNFLKQQNVRIPEEVAIATFSGTVLSTVVHPQLTSVEQPLRLMGQRAADLILKKITDPTMPNQKIVLGSDIHLRGTTDGEVDH